MNASQGGPAFRNNSMARIVVFLLANMFFGLMLDIRVEHVEVVHEKMIAWVPIFYSAGMGVISLVAVVFWNRVMRRILLPLFLLSMAVGLAGVYFHSHGFLQRVLHTNVRAWTDPEMTHPDGPPLTAPMAFVGFGILGALASLNRFSDVDA